MAAALRWGDYSDTENHYELQNYTTISGGAHTWKFGVRVRAVTVNNFSPTNFGGTYNFYSGYGLAPHSDGGYSVTPAVTACDAASPNPDCTHAAIHSGLSAHVTSAEPSN